MELYAKVAVHWAIALLAGMIVLVLQVSLLKNRPKLKVPNHPSSFFDIDELVSTRRLRTITYLVACPISILVFFLAAEATPFVEQTRKFLILSLSELVNEKRKDDLASVLQNVPDYLSPLFVLLGSAFLFVPYIRKPLELVRDYIIRATGIESRAEKAARFAAELALRRLEDDEAEEKLEDLSGSDVPLPPELIHADDKTKLAYQILFFSSDKTKKLGLEASISDTLIRMGVSGKVPVERAGFVPSRVIGALGVYLALCIFYVFLIPEAAPLLSNPSPAGLFLVEWPLAKYRGVLTLTLVQQTLAFVVPFAIGIWLYPSRRRQFALETAFQSFAVVFVVQFVFSSFVNFWFDALFIARRSVGDFTRDLISFEDIKIWADIFIPAFAPAAALAIWIWCKDFRTRWLSYVVLCLTSGVLLNICQLAYECISGTLRGYFWHQSLLGMFLMLLFCLVSEIIRVHPPAQVGRKSPVQV